MNTYREGDADRAILLKSDDSGATWYPVGGDPTDIYHEKDAVHCIRLRTDDGGTVWVPFEADIAVSAPAGALADWNHKRVNQDIVNVACVGDSIVEGVGADSNATSWVSQVRDVLQTAKGDLSGGFYGLQANEWGESGTWTSAATNVASDKAPWGQCRVGSGATATYTWTNPSTTVDKFQLVFIDTGTTATFSYRIDGGSWVNVVHTFAHDDALVAVEVNSAVTTTLDVRCANAAGTAASLFFVGAETLTDETTGGLVHNLGFSANYAAIFARETIGDAFAIFDKYPPDLTIIGPFSNDLALYNTLGATADEARAAYAADIEQIIDDVKAHGSDVLLVACYEQGDSADRPIAEQAQFRDELHRLAGEKDCAIYDFYTAWGTDTVSQAAGLQDGIHPTQAGHDDMATRIIQAIGL